MSDHVICWRCGKEELTFSHEHVCSDGRKHAFHNVDSEKELWYQYVKLYHGVQEEVDDTKHCYFCGRTAKQCKIYTDAFVEEHYDEFSNSFSTENLEERLKFIKKCLLKAESKSDNVREIEKMEDLEDRINQILTVSSDIISKYSSWDSNKISAAMQCDYPFADGELNKLRSLNYNCELVYKMRESLPLDECEAMTIGAVYNAVIKNKTLLMDHIHNVIEENKKSKIEDLPIDKKIVHKMIVDYYSSPNELEKMEIGSFRIEKYDEETVRDACRPCTHLKERKEQIKFDVDVCWICNKQFSHIERTGDYNREIDFRRK